MKKLLMLTIVLGMQVWGMEDIEEEQFYPNPYSNLKPSATHIYTIDMKECLAEANIAEDDKLMVMQKKIARAFSEIDLYNLCGSFCSSDNSIAYVLGNIMPSKLGECVIVDIQYKEKALKPKFEKIECITYPRTKQIQDWSVQIDECIEFVDDSCIRMSWKWVDMAIHRMNDTLDYNNKKEYSLCKSLYKKIENEKLENALTRLSVVVDADDQYAFNIVYESLEQFIRTQKIADDLYAAIS